MANETSMTISSVTELRTKLCDYSNEICIQLHNAKQDLSELLDAGFITGSSVEPLRNGGEKIAESSKKLMHLASNIKSEITKTQETLADLDEQYGKVFEQLASTSPSQYKWEK